MNEELAIAVLTSQNEAFRAFIQGVMFGDGKEANDTLGWVERISQMTGNEAFSFGRSTVESHKKK